MSDTTNISMMEHNCSIPIFVRTSDMTTTNPIIDIGVTNINNINNVDKQTPDIYITKMSNNLYIAEDIGPYFDDNDSIVTFDISSNSDQIDNKKVDCKLVRKKYDYWYSYSHYYDSLRVLNTEFVCSSKIKFITYNESQNNITTFIINNKIYAYCKYNYNPFFDNRLFTYVRYWYGQQNESVYITDNIYRSDIVEKNNEENIISINSKYSINTIDEFITITKYDFKLDVIEVTYNINKNYTNDFRGNLLAVFNYNYSNIKCYSYIYFIQLPKNGFIVARVLCYNNINVMPKLNAIDNISTKKIQYYCLQGAKGEIDETNKTCTYIINNLNYNNNSITENNLPYYILLPSYMTNISNIYAIDKNNNSIKCTYTVSSNLIDYTYQDGLTYYIYEIKDNNDKYFCISGIKCIKIETHIQ